VAQEWLRNNKEESINIANRLLVAIRQSKMPPSVLMHILISLSYLNRSEVLRSYVESPGCQFSDKISAFVEYYSKVPLNANVDSEESKQDARSD